MRRPLSAVKVKDVNDWKLIAGTRGLQLDNILTQKTHEYCTSAFNQKHL